MFKVGDVVRIREGLKWIYYDGLNCAPQMVKFKGLTCVITAISWNSKYILRDIKTNLTLGYDEGVNAGEGWYWNDAMLVDYAPIIDFLREVGNV